MRWSPFSPILLSMLFIHSQIKKGLTLLLFLVGMVGITSCIPQGSLTANPAPEPPQGMPTVKSIEDSTSPAAEVNPVSRTEFADVLSVEVTGAPGAYRFAVEISSPDTGCDQYADWWEVFTDERLLYRRILLHSHVGEQPFVRTGGPVDIETDTVVYVRGHMNTVGYGGKVMMGSVRDGFKPVEVEAGLRADLERIPPQPQDCAF